MSATSLVISTPDVVAAKLFAKLTAIGKQLQRVPRNGTNPKPYYKFAALDDILDMVRPLMAENGLALFVSLLSSEVKEVGKTYNDQPKNEMTCWFEFTVCCAETGVMVSSRWAGSCLTLDDKSINKCSAQAEKYWLQRTFMLSTGDADMDGESSSDTDGQPAAAAPASETKNPPALKNAPDGWTSTEASQFYHDLIKNAGATEKEVLAALGVTRLGEFKGGTKAARQAWNNFVAQKTSSQQATKSA